MIVTFEWISLNLAVRDSDDNIKFDILNIRLSALQCLQLQKKKGSDEEEEDEDANTTKRRKNQKGKKKNKGDDDEEEEDEGNTTKRRGRAAKVNIKITYYQLQLQLGHKLCWGVHVSSQFSYFL